MNALVTVAQTATGWHVEVNEAGHVVVDIDESKITVEVEAEPEETKPLAVTLA